MFFKNNYFKIFSFFQSNINLLFRWTIFHYFLNQFFLDHKRGIQKVLMKNSMILCSMRPGGRPPWVITPLLLSCEGDDDWVVMTCPSSASTLTVLLCPLTPAMAWTMSGKIIRLYFPIGSILHCQTRDETIIDK